MDGNLPANTTHPGTEIMSWRVSGMDCGACVSKVETAVKRLPGIANVQVNLMSETLTLSRAADGAAAEAVERQVAALGYRASRIVDVVKPPSADAGGSNTARRRSPRRMLMGRLMQVSLGGAPARHSS
jgi:copper chaperone CopZ